MPNTNDMPDMKEILSLNTQAEAQLWMEKQRALKQAPAVQMTGLTTMIPALERRVADLKREQEEARRVQTIIENGLIVKGIEGKNEPERKARLAQELAINEGYIVMAKQLDTTDMLLLDATQELGEATHRWTLCRLLMEADTAQAYLMAAREKVRP